jgi:hypothetical protein
VTVLIGLNGRRGAGKDTAFGFIQEWAAERGLHAARRGFADLLKLSFARLFIPDCSIDEAVSWCDTLKEDSDLELSWTREDAHQTLTTIQHRITGRQALQRHGTEGHRDVFGPDFWIDALLPIGGDISHNFSGPFDQKFPEICCVTDTRFENEARRIRERGGVVVEIVRGKENQDQHISEVPLPADLIDTEIWNDGTMDDLRRRVRTWCGTNIGEVGPYMGARDA